MKYKSIFNVCLLTAFLLTATTSCDDWTEMEIHETDVNGAKEQKPGTIFCLYAEHSGL